MTLAEIQQDTYFRLNYESVPAPNVSAAILRFINESQNEIVSRPGTAALLRGNSQIATTANRWQYGLPQAVARVSSVTDGSNQWRLREMSLDEFRSIQPNPSLITGTPSHWVYLEDSPVSRQPTAATADRVYVECSSAADTTQTLFVEYVTDGGDQKTVSYALQGTAVIAAISTDDVIQITDCYLSAETDGTVILRLALIAGTILTTIAAGTLRGHYKQILFYPTPSDALTYDIEYDRELAPLVNPTDEPILPLRFHHLLGVGARKKRYEQTGDLARLAVVTREWNDGLALVNNYLVNRPDQCYVPGGPTGYPSVLPGWYPPSNYRRW